VLPQEPVTRRATSAHEPRLARVAAMVAEPARSRMLAFLLDGEYASAGELARAGGVQASTASTHLAQLLEAGLVACEPRGRHRYFRLADGEVAHALSALALVAERRTHDRAWQHPERAPLREARCCYGHLAGRLGVALLDRLRDGCLRECEHGFELTPAGAEWLRGLGLEPPRERAAQRLAYGCLDWSERRDHLAGSLARALLAHFLERGWLRKAASPASRGGHRALELTPTGRRHLLPLLALG
jgi:DNA-binding transcriptional ArsR family regulator